MKKALLLLTLFIALSVSVLAQNIELVKDINPYIYMNTGDSDPANFIEMNGYMYFTAESPGYGKELWRTDGISSTMVKDIFPGLSHSNISSITVLNNVLYFSAESSNSNRELWRSDGTNAGTYLVKDINASGSSSPSYLTVLNNKLYFSANATTYIQLWCSDGTSGGTTLVLDLPVGNDNVASITRFNNILVFSANGSSSANYDIWTSDGTALGTTLVKRYSTNNVSNLTATSDKVYFTVNDGVNGNELWSTDGTLANTQVYDICTGSCSSNPSNLYAYGQTLYCSATTTASGTEPWIVKAGIPSLLSELSSGSSSSTPNYFTEAGGKVYFVAFNTGDYEYLYSTDGTTTTAIKNTYLSPGADNIKGLMSMNGILYFYAFSSTAGDELWRSNGTSAGTVMIKDILPGLTSSNTSVPVKIFGFNNNVYFGATTTMTGLELWRSDGTAIGTQLFAEINPTNTGSCIILGVINGKIMLNANDGTHGMELWISDGTDAGTYMVKDIIPGGSSSLITSPMVMGNILYFTAYDANGTELWRSDGTTAGTYLVSNIAAGNTSSNPKYLTPYNGELYFSAELPANNTELWKTDGTSAGTVLVKEISATGASNPSGFCVSNNILYFSATDGINGFELWKTDGTSNGTVMVKDINPGASGSNPGGKYDYNNTLLFAAITSTEGSELWTSDGTTSGTVLVSDIYPGSSFSSSPSGFTNGGGIVYFKATTGTAGTELWRTDGTPGGTYMVKDLNPGSSSSSTSALAWLNNKLYFVGSNATGGGLCVSDGTSANTSVIKTFTAPLSEFTLFENQIYFNGSDPFYKSELWKTDGTASGTVLAKDINLNDNIGDPHSFTVVGNTMYFVATDYRSQGLWKLYTPAIPSAPVLSYSLSGNDLTLNWTNVSDETNYVLEQSVGNNTSYTTLAQPGLDVTTHQLNSLSNDVYYFKIKSVNETGTSPYSNEVMVVVNITGTLSDSGILYSIFPNPNDGNLTVSGVNTTDTHVQYSIYNVSGSLVQKGEGELPLRLNLNQSGMYVLYLQNEKGGSSYRLIKY